MGKKLDFYGKAVYNERKVRIAATVAAQGGTGLMSLNRLKATICGTTYTLVSDDSLSYMRDLVAQVDAQMSEIVTNDSRMSTTMAAVLTALQNADTATKETRAAEELRLQLKRVVDECEHLKDQLASARAEVDRLSKEMVAMRTAKAPAAPAAPAPMPTAPAAKASAAVPTRSFSTFEEILDDMEEL